MPKRTLIYSYQIWAKNHNKGNNIKKWLLSKGYTQNLDGSYSNPPINSEYIKSLKEKQ